MNNIALAILVVGICFYQGYLKVNNKNEDVIASIIAFIGAIILLTR